MRNMLKLGRWSGTAFAALFTAVIFLNGGCATASVQSATAARPAALVIENHANCAWQVSASVAGATQQVTVPIAGTVRLDLAPGECAVTQEALSGVPMSDSVRKFSMSLESGETYRWELVTLLAIPQTQ